MIKSTVVKEEEVVEEGFPKLMQFLPQVDGPIALFLSSDRGIIVWSKDGMSVGRPADVKSNCYRTFRGTIQLSNE